MNPLNNQRMADVVTGLYQDLEEQLMSNIIRHIKDYGKPIDSDDWLLQKLAEIGKLNKENIKIISQMSGIANNEAEGLLYDAANEAIQQLEPCMQNAVNEALLNTAVEVDKSKNIKQTMTALQSQTVETLNMCNTNMLYKARDTYKNLVTNICTKAKEIEQKQSFIDLLNKNAVNTVMGATSRTQAVTQCIKEFNERGIPAFVDKAGREWTPEAYVNMCMRNTVRNVADEVQTARCKDYGCNLIEIDSHAGARPKCAKDQGKVFSLDNEEGDTEDAKGNKIHYYAWNSSSYGQPDGILGINCGHHKYPFVPGVNIRRHFPTEDMDENNRLYKETQVQRALERDVRKQKRECMLYDEIGDEEAFEKASIKLKAKEAKLKQYVDSKDHLHRRKDREQVVGFDKRVSSKAVSANKKALRNTVKPVENSGESGIIKINKGLKENLKKSSNKKFSKTKDFDQKTNTPTVENDKAIVKGSFLWEDNKRKKLKQQEAIIRCNNYETAVVYDINGNILLQKKGTRNSVTFTSKEIRKLKGTVITHNHPNGSCFSSEDINILRISGASEMRASTRYGTYVITPPKKWHNKISTLEKLDTEYNDYLDAALIRSKDKAAQQGEPIFKYLRESEVEGAREFFKNYGFSFRVEELD